ncbi:MAG: hypothetical protein AAGU11_09660 [Syntrophobacteraceae bacterium]
MPLRRCGGKPEDRPEAVLRDGLPASGAERIVAVPLSKLPDLLRVKKGVGSCFRASCGPSSIIRHFLAFLSNIQYQLLSCSFSHGKNVSFIARGFSQRRRVIPGPSWQNRGQIDYNSRIKE